MTRDTCDLLAIQQASPADQAAALQLVLDSLPLRQREEAITRLLNAALRDPADLAGLWIARRAGRLVGAVWGQLQPGRTAAVSIPRVVDGETNETRLKLMAALSNFLLERNVRLAQTLLETDQGPDADLLQAAGFAHITDLLYLISAAGAFPVENPARDLEFEPYLPESGQRLAQIIERTYEQTRDCPQLNGVRNMADVLAGYQATGQWDPQRWMIVKQHGADVGCLLLAEHPADNQWELVYMGLVPEARGRGLGVAIARYAQWLASHAGRSRLVLAVDAANDPAINMYAAAGFMAWDRRSVWLRVYPTAATT